jgi:UDP-N-acetylglucosamine--N-acetylmuramyl-(pentapeptide) pyrophosphoryl-undecaprenol N-acetylglucosamine transferase
MHRRKHDTRMPEGLRVVIAGGGTGGHLYPGIAVARELLSRRPAASVTFAGTARGIEGRVVPREGFELDTIRSGGLKGKSRVDSARGAALIPLGILDAWRLLSRRRPHLVVGVGGYSSGPVVLVAALRGVPTMLLEQNAVPGLTNRVLSYVVRAAAVTYESTAAFFGAKAVLSGNPVRAEFVDGVYANPEGSSDGQSSGVGVLIFGGSQGAHAINVAMVEAAPRLAALDVTLHVTHQTGERDVELVRSAYAAAGLDADVQPFIYDMGRRMARADLIVCRAGATTLAELTTAAKPSILIPLPTATDDHQRKNAEVLASAGAASLMLQNEATGGALAERIAALVRDPDARARMSAAARMLGRPDAAKVIVDKALELAQQ